MTLDVDKAVLDGVLESVRSVVTRRQIPDDADTLAADLFETGILDSLGWIRLLDELEDRFDVELDIEALDENNVTSLNDLAQYIQAQKG